MTDNKFFVHAYAQVSFYLNGARQKLERGAVYGPIDQNLVDQVKRTATNTSYRIVEDKAKGKVVEVNEATPIPSTVRSPIKISEPTKTDVDPIAELLKPVTISLSPSVSAVDKSQLPSSIPVGEESVSLDEYAKEPVVIPDKKRLLQDKVDSALETAKAEAVEKKAKPSKAKVAFIEPEAVNEAV